MASLLEAVTVAAQCRQSEVTHNDQQVMTYEDDCMNLLTSRERDSEASLGRCTIAALREKSRFLWVHWKLQDPQLELIQRKTVSNWKLEESPWERIQKETVSKWKLQESQWERIQKKATSKEAQLFGKYVFLVHD